MELTPKSRKDTAMSMMSAWVSPMPIMPPLHVSRPAFWILYRVSTRSRYVCVETMFGVCAWLVLRFVIDAVNPGVFEALRAFCGEQAQTATDVDIDFAFDLAHGVGQGVQFPVGGSAATGDDAVAIRAVFTGLARGIHDFTGRPQGVFVDGCGGDG